MSKIRVLLADDHAILRSGLRVLLEAQSDMQVIGEAADGASAVALAGSLQPDVITLDLSMPGGTGSGTIAKLRAAAKTARIVVLTMHEDPAYVRSALAAGAAGYVAKSAADEALMEAIRSVQRGRVFIDVERTPSTEAWMSSGVEAPVSAPIERLSTREREVLTLVARGYTNRAIGEQLSLSVKTVESYRARLMRKLGLNGRADVTRLAMDLGLLDDSSSGPAVP